MANPFPGMNPYLERFWGDVHTSLTTYARDEIQTQLPPGLKARVEEQVRLEAEDDFGLRVPDVTVFERPKPTSSGGGTALAEVDVTEPYVVEIGNDPITERRILITDQSTGNRVVTAIEFVCPTDKIAESERRRFRAKQRAMLDGDVAVVEIDLLRQGLWVVTAPADLVPEPCRYPYAICVARYSWRFECYAAPLQKPLPTIRIPLREGDEDVVLPLQKVVDLAIERGAYDDIDYANQKPAGFTPEDMEWIESTLKEQGL